MSFENRHIFQGKINDKNIYDFIKLDYNIQNIEDRLLLILSILNNGGLDFFIEYFDSYYKTNVNQYDELSEKNNICKALENMTNYLLGSEEIREERKNDVQQYKFYIDKQEFNLRTRKKEESLEGKIGFTNNKVNDYSSDNGDSIIHFLLGEGKNTKKSKKQFITNSDLNKDTYCSEVLKQYDTLLKTIDSMLADPEKFKGIRYKLTKMKSDINYDMIYCKNHLNGVFGEKPKNLLNGYSNPSWEKFDFTNHEHIKKLIYMQIEFNPDDDISFLIMDLDTLIQRARKDGRFTDKEYQALRMIRKGYKNIEIADELQVDKSRITALVNVITKKICKLADELGYES